ncbi:hypothetical protein TRIATDRAFT_236441, partial [Trichoderma atroviride IMI 206040]
MHRGIGPLLWGSVKLTMLTAVECASYYEELSRLLMDLGRYCPCWTEYHTLYSSSSQLQKTLCNFYASLVRCCKRAMEIVPRKGSNFYLNSVWQSFEPELVRDINDIKRHNKDIEEALFLAQAQVDLQNQQFQNTEQRESSKGAKLKSLFIRQNSQFSEMKTWQAEMIYFNSPIIVGSGKTILTASVIDKLLTEKRGPDVFISFFFVRYDDRQSLKAEVILRSIIRQALNQCGFAEDVEILLEKIQASLSSGLEELLELLQKIVTAFKVLYIIMDGVDECERQDRSDILHVLSSLATATLNTKIFLASRDSISLEIQKRFPTLHRLAMNCSSAHSDISTYVDGIVQEKLQSEELIVGDSRLIEDIKLALTEGADGMFLWVAFQVDELSLQHCDDDIRKAIHNLPKDLEETFDRAVGRIVSRGNENIAQRVFRWVAAAAEPLSLDQLKEVIFIEIGQQYSKAERQSNGIDHIGSWCENLVHIDEEFKTVQFAHRTIQQFFSKKPSTARHNQFYLDIEEADHYIGEICTTYLNFNDFKTTLAQRSRPLRPIPPVAIASTALRQQWKSVASTFEKFSLKPRGGSTAANAIESLANFQRDGTTEANGRLQIGHSFLRYASKHWICHTARFQKGRSKTWSLWWKMILEGNNLVELPWGEGSFSTSISLILEWSHKFHHYALIQLICLIGRLSTEERKRLMQDAVSQGNIILLDIVLEGEKPGYLIDRSYLAAAKGGHLDVVERLLAAGAGVNVRFAERTCRTALQSATIHGHLEVVERLLAAGARVETPADLYGQTALEVAAQGGHLDVVERLLAAGARVNSNADFYDETALQVAAEGGHLDVVERLLASGANVNAQPLHRRGRAALQAAAANGHLDVVERLLAAGA